MNTPNRHSEPRRGEESHHDRIPTCRQAGFGRFAPQDDALLVSVRLDCCGQLCPVPILMTEEKMTDLKTHDILEVVFTDPGAEPDLAAWCQATGNTLLKITRENHKRFATIRKG